MIILQKIKKKTNLIVFSSTHTRKKIHQSDKGVIKIESEKNKLESFSFSGREEKEKERKGEERKRYKLRVFFYNLKFKEQKFQN